MCANEQLRVCFYALIRYSLLFSSEIIQIPLRLSEYCRIIPLTSSRRLFDNIHFTFGELLLNGINMRMKHHLKKLECSLWHASCLRLETKGCSVKTGHKVNSSQMLFNFCPSFSHWMPC